MALMIGCIWHGLDALQGTRAKPGNHLVIYINLRRSRDCLWLSLCVCGWGGFIVSYALHLLILDSSYAVHINALSLS